VSDSIRPALERLVFLDGCADQSPDWKQAWRDAMAAAQAALAGHDRQIGSSADTGLLPMIVSETGSDDEPEIERIICSAISGGADYVNGMPRELSLQRIKGGKSVFARYIQGPLEVDMPTPAPTAGGLMERVGADAIWLTDEKLDEPCHSSGDDLLKTYCDARRAFYFEAAEGESDQGDRKAAAIAGLRAVIAADRARLGREHGAAANSKPTPNDRQIGSLSDALIKAECALADIAEGEPTTDEGDPLKWNQQRCADTLSIIRPVMLHHGIRTSEWPGSGFNPPQPLPAPAGVLKESLTDVWNEGLRLRRYAATAVIEVIASWLEHQQDIPTGVSADYFATLLRKEAVR
jgi:hypothetical protein